MRSDARSRHNRRRPLVYSVEDVERVGSRGDLVVS